MSDSRARVFCEGGSATIPCPHSGWLRIGILGRPDTETVVCGKHYRSVTLGLLRGNPNQWITGREV